jgi:hypothetical protein
MTDILQSKTSFDRFLHDVVVGTFPRSRWNHAAHLAYAAWVLWNGGRYDGVRSAILAYSKTQGIVSTPDSGYHETVTHFWCDRILELGPHETAYHLALRAVDVLAGQRELLSKYYSFDVIANREARATYVPPDRV